MDAKEASLPYGAHLKSVVKPDRLFWISVVVVAIVPLVALLSYHAARFAGLTNSDALDFAQLGRNLWAGRGFTTYVLRPLALTHAGAATRQPDVVHGPLHPFLLALAFGLLGPKDNVASIVSGLFYLLTVPVLYRLGRELFPPAVAVAAALAFALSPAVLDFATSGLHVTLYVFLTTWLLLGLYRLLQNAQAEETSRSTRRCAAVGILTGLLYLADPIFSWAVPCVVIAVILSHPTKRLSAAAWFGVPFAIVVLPWMVRNGILTGHPVVGLRGAEIWMNTRAYPGTTGYRMLPGGMAPPTALLGALFEKMLVGINQIVTGLPRLASSWLLAFFVPSLLFRYKDAGVEGLRTTAIALFGSLCAAMLLFGVQMPLFFSLLPVILLFSIAYLVHIVEQARLNRSSLPVAYSLVAALTLYPLFAEFAITDRENPLPLAASARLLGRQAPANEACASDQPWAVAWYADRPALWIPAEDETLWEAGRRIGGVRWLFITEQARRGSPAWQYVYDTLADWNTEWRESRMANAVPPERIVIDSGGQPLMDALDGFTSVEPADEMAPGIVIAHAEPKSQDEETVPASDTVVPDPPDAGGEQ